MNENVICLTSKSDKNNAVDYVSSDFNYLIRLLVKESDEISLQSHNSCQNIFSRPFDDFFFSFLTILMWENIFKEFHPQWLYISQTFYAQKKYLWHEEIQRDMTIFRGIYMMQFIIFVNVMTTEIWIEWLDCRMGCF